MSTDGPGPSRRAFRTVATLLVVLVLLNIVGALWYVNRPRPVKPTALDRQNARTELFLRMRPDSNAIIFLGDSHTEYFPLQEIFPGLPVVNRGVSSSTSAQVLARAIGSCGPAPSMIFVQAGINDLFQRIPVDGFEASMTDLLDTLHATFPEARIVLQSLLPTMDAGMDPDVRRCNEVLARLAIERNLAYVDLYPVFAARDLIDERLTYDGVHLTAAGYFKWAEMIRPLLPKE